jgi:hypothetical protein
MKGRSKFSQGLSKELLNSPVIVRNAEGGREIGDVVDLSDATFNPEYKFITQDGQERVVQGFVRGEGETQTLVISLSQLVNRVNGLDEAKSGLMKQLRKCTTLGEILEVMDDVESVKVIDVKRVPNRFVPGTERTLCLWDEA